MVGSLVALAFAAQVAGQPQASPVAPAQVRLYHDVALSPAGDKVAVIETDDVAGSQADPHETVAIRDRATGDVQARVDPCSVCDYAGPAWSPDGRTLAFVASDRHVRTAALILVRDGKPAVALDFQGLLAQPRWSPDGQTLAVLATERPRKQTGATQAGAALVGEIGRETDEQRVAVLVSAPDRAPGMALRFLSPADTFVYEYDWTPDGKGFVVSEAKGDGDNNWWVARLARVGIDGAFREIAAPPVQIKFPRVSPDGKTVAFVGGLMSDFGPTGGDLWIAPLAGGRAVNRTPAFKGSFSSLTWRKSGLFATALVGDQTALMSVDPATGATRTLYSAAAGFAAADGRISLDREGKVLAAQVETFTAAPQVIAGPIASPKPITHENDAVPAMVTARSLAWTSDGYDVQGWLLGPKDAPPGKLPMIVEVHGGPSAAAQPHFEWKDTIYDLVAHGYYVLMPNPRGSFGQGEAFTRANIKDFGGGDLRDILAGVDAAVKAAPIDETRLGVYGHSYGGFMTMWAVTHSQRFKAAVAGAGIADWVAYYGQNGIDQWMVPFFGATAYDDPSVYDRLSPIRYVKAARTPTFIYVGERDVECPPAQSLEFHHGLDAMGVPNTLVIYPGEGHGIRDAAHRSDLKRRILGWFDQHLGAPGGAVAAREAR